MRGKPNVEAFMAGASEDVRKPARAPAPENAQSPADKMTKKIFSLPEALVIEVERRCTDERVVRGRKVTQREVVEALLRKWVQGEVKV